MLLILKINTIDTRSHSVFKEKSERVETFHSVKGLGGNIGRRDALGFFLTKKKKSPTSGE